MYSKSTCKITITYQIDSLSSRHIKTYTVAVDFDITTLLRMTDGYQLRSDETVISLRTPLPDIFFLGVLFASGYDGKKLLARLVKRSTA